MGFDSFSRCEGKEDREFFGSSQRQCVFRAWFEDVNGDMGHEL
jgi:hypothetical protein